MRLYSLKASLSPVTSQHVVCHSEVVKHRNGTQYCFDQALLLVVDSLYLFVISSNYHTYNTVQQNVISAL